MKKKRWEYLSIIAGVFYFVAIISTNNAFSSIGGDEIALVSIILAVVLTAIYMFMKQGVHPDSNE